MAIKSLGQYLIEVGVLTPEQLIACVDSDADADGDTPSSDGSQVARQAIELGFVTGEDMGEQVLAYERDQAPFETAEFELPDDLGASPLVSTSIDLTIKLLLRVARLYGRRSAPRLLTGRELVDDFVYADVCFRGDIDVEYSLQASRSLVCELIRAQFGDPLALPESMHASVLAEFCNTVAGNVCSKLAAAGIDIDIDPPRTEPVGTPARGIALDFELPGSALRLQLMLEAARDYESCG